MGYNKTMTKKEAYRSPLSEHGTKAECPKCGKRVKKGSGLKKHLRDVHGVKT